MPRKEYCKATLTESFIGIHHTWEYSQLSRTRPKKIVNLQSSRKTTLITRDNGVKKVELICGISNSQSLKKLKKIHNIKYIDSLTLIN